MRVISVRECPEYCEQAIEYTADKWATKESRPVYRDSIAHALTAPGPLPQWYLLLDDAGRPAGCAGLIPNDFVSRMDLWPWLCALYVEEAHRGRGNAGRLIARAERDARAAGFESIYLCSDHVGFYERYGYQRIGAGYHPWGETSGVFAKALDDPHIS